MQSASREGLLRDATLSASLLSVFPAPATLWVLVLLTLLKGQMQFTLLRSKNIWT